MRDKQQGVWAKEAGLESLGLDREMIHAGVRYTYGVLDSLDEKLVNAGELRLSGLIELANLSAMIGNLFRGGLAKASEGKFQANRPHKYPDLVSLTPGIGDVEIKVALEAHSPKGHLIKPGPHVTVRYVLGDEHGTCVRGKENRGSVVWIWEIRAGVLLDGHFNESNTKGDSGKTAVINKAGMGALKVVFVDLDRCPISTKGRRFAALKALENVNLELFP